MKTLFLSLLLSSTFLMSEAKHHREKNQSSKKMYTEQAPNMEATTTGKSSMKPANKSRTLRTGLIMLGAGTVSTITGAGMALGAGEDRPTMSTIGVGLFVAGIGSTISGAAVTLVGLLLPRD